jgi:hypothetical protein
MVTSKPRGDATSTDPPRDDARCEVADAEVWYMVSKVALQRLPIFADIDNMIVHQRTYPISTAMHHSHSGGNKGSIVKQNAK